MKDYNTDHITILKSNNLPNLQMDVNDALQRADLNGRVSFVTDEEYYICMIEWESPE
jgi:hypothetical protein